MAKHSKKQAELEAKYEELLGKLPSRAPIYLPTEKIPLEDKIRGAEHVIRIYKNDLDAIYRPKLRALRERFKGSKRCFLIGNGPSLNKTDLAALKNEVTFAVNGFFLKAAELDWTPTFYVVEDHLVAEDRVQWINDFKGPIKLFPAYLGYMFDKSDDTIFYNHRPRKSYPHGFDFSLEADKITYTGCTVTFSMMQLAAYLGFEEIYLIGVDASYAIPEDAKEGKDYSVGVLDMQSDDPNHFDPNYFGKGFRWHDPQVEKMVEAYAEARRTLEGTGQTIYNATIGGMLEVFERRDFNKVLPLARKPEEVEADNLSQSYPKMLMLDMTAMGNGTATGEIKSNLARNWPADRLLQLARHGKDGLALVKRGDNGRYPHEVVEREAAFARIKAFDPDVVMYRPVPNVPWLHDAAMALIDDLKKPVMTWVMDDWPAELAETDPDQWSDLKPDLEWLLEQSAERLSICESMSEGMGERYGVNFTALANGVDPDDWTEPRVHEPKRLRIRYAGGLARNMTRDSVLRVARAVESLGNSGHSVTFEINTQPWWYREAKSAFEEFRFTKLTSEDRPAKAYRAWLSRSDVAVIAYNFDDITLRYVRYSMANKMPECLASGAILLAHGPREAATIDYLAGKDIASVVSEPTEAAIESELLRLMADHNARKATAERARAFVFDNHNINTLGETFRNLAAKAAKGHAPAVAATPAAAAPTPEPTKAAAPTTSAGTPPSAQVVPLRSLGEKAQREVDLLSIAAGRSALQLVRALIVELTLAPDATAARLVDDVPLRNKIIQAISTISADDPLRAACIEAIERAELSQTLQVAE